MLVLTAGVRHDVRKAFGTMQPRSGTQDAARLEIRISSPNHVTRAATSLNVHVNGRCVARDDAAFYSEHNA